MPGLLAGPQLIYLKRLDFRIRRRTPLDLGIFSEKYLYMFKHLVFTFFTVLMANQAFGVSADCSEKAPNLIEALSPLLNKKPEIIYLQLPKICAPLSQPELYQKLASARHWESSATEVLSIKRYVDEQTESVKKVYYAGLQEIGKKKDLYARLQRAFELAVKSYGFFQRPQAKLEIWREMKLRNARGANAQRSALVVYTLSQVVKKEEAKFTVMVAPLEAKSQLSHAWIQVSIGPGFNKKIDLDPMLTGLDLVPFFSRKSGLSSAYLETVQKECLALKICLAKRPVGDGK